LKKLSFIFLVNSLIVLIFILTGCNNIGKNTTVAKIDGFDEFVLSELSKYGKVKILNEIERGNIDTSKYKLIYVDVSKNKRSKALENLKKIFKDTDYQVFYTSVGYDNAPEKICILRSKDKYESLKALNTNSVNYDVDTDTLIKKLQDWDTELGIDIMGLDGDWVDIKFKKLPHDIEKFANDIYKFCPDSVDQGVGDIDELSKLLKEDKQIFLWWD
jgi:hypothetical protein